VVKSVKLFGDFLQLREVPGLAERMAALMCMDLDKKVETEEADNEEINPSERNKIVFGAVEKEMCRVKENGREAVAWLEFEELGIDDEMLCSLDLSTKFPVS
jgi:tubulin--tyrosine ligase-like protein 12